MRPQRLVEPVSMSATAKTITVALAISLLTGFGRILAQSKLDTSRFVADSITSHFERQEDRTLLRQIDAKLTRVCAKIRCDDREFSP